MSEFESKAVEHLHSLADAARAFWERGAMTDGGSIDEDFEMELVRAEDFLEGVVGDADI